MDHQFPLVSVVTVFFNRKDLVAPSIGSLLQQTYPNMEIIVVSDGSTDGTGEAVEAIEDPRVRLIKQSNSGFTRSIREAIRQSRGEFIAVHGSGDISHPHRIARQVDILLKNPDVGVVGCYVEAKAHIGGNSIFMRPSIAPDLTKQLRNENPFTHGEVMYRRNIYDQVGGYRPFFTFAQDRDLWLRMSLVTRFFVVPEMLYVRKNPANAVSADPIKASIQSALSDFAVQCAVRRQEFGSDLLDDWGDHGVLFRAKSRPLSFRLLLLGARLIHSGNAGDGRKIITMSIHEYCTFTGYLVSMLSKATDSPGLVSKLIVSLVKVRISLGKLFV